MKCTSKYTITPKKHKQCSYVLSESMAQQLDWTTTVNFKLIKLILAKANERKTKEKKTHEKVQ